jgi:hypothetical protein
VHEEAEDSVVELIADPAAPVQTWKQLFTVSQARKTVDIA